MSSDPACSVARIELEPKWLTLQRDHNERVERERAAARADVSTTNFERSHYAAFFDALAFEVAPEDEWTARERILEAFRDAHVDGNVERDAFMSELGEHLVSKFGTKALRRRKDNLNITSARVPSEKVNLRVNKKLAKAKRMKGRQLDPNRSRKIVASKAADAISSRYMTEFLQLHCATELVESRVFPDAKELTESFSAFNAWRTHLSDDFSADDPNITLVSVGDGHTPRTAALFAFRTRWNCVAVDPEMGFAKDSKASYAIDRLQHHRAKIEEMRIKTKRCIIVMVHAHVSLATTLRSIEASEDGTAACIALPCCNYYSAIDAPNRAVPEYEDMSVISPHRTVRVWKALPCGAGYFPDRNRIGR